MVELENPLWTAATNKSSGSYFHCLSGVKVGKKEIKSKANLAMESARQEMDLLSNSIAAFAHIKGEAP